VVIDTVANAGSDLHETGVTSTFLSHICCSIIAC